MKKLFALLASVSIASGVAACGASNGGGADGAGAGKAGSNGAGGTGGFQVDFSNGGRPASGATGGSGNVNSPGSSENGGCRKVDLVFAVDNSSSMQEEKKALASDVFPKFAKALRDVGGGLDDYRVGVIDACPKPATLHVKGTSGACNFAGGQTWMQSASANLEQEFACVGSIDSADTQCSGRNDDEQPASSASAVVEASLAGTANKDFIRKDALLVVVAITDEDEQPVPAMSTSQLFERMKALKGGDASRIVFLGIGGTKACQGLYGDAEEAKRLKELTGLFEAAQRGVFWDLCAGKLEDGLTQAMSVINKACEAFVPVVL
ncbi:MAG: hypothetical protein SF187_23190 [Deltaproteobacteria bacterium]|nr:hypothetical protein [Deltaproteobacteria bacterium]